jgi:hypothetical protein
VATAERDLLLAERLVMGVAAGEIALQHGFAHVAEGHQVELFGEGFGVENRILGVGGHGLCLAAFFSGAEEAKRLLFVCCFGLGRFAPKLATAPDIKAFSLGFLQKQQIPSFLLKTAPVAEAN